MFCPKCAGENQDHTTYCRSCGTNLEVVAVALSSQLTPSLELGEKDESKRELTQERLKLRVDGIRHIVQGALLFATGALLGVPLALFSHNSDWHSNWILIWLFCCSWLPVWGAITIGTGVTNLIHSRMMMRDIDSGSGPWLTMVSVPRPSETQRIAETQSATEVSAHLSASERTIDSLDETHSDL